MRLLYVADGRSPIALNWINHFIETGHEVHLASTFPCEAVTGLASLTNLPVPMSGLYRTGGQGGGESGGFIRRIIPVKIRTFVRRMMTPQSIPGAASALQEAIGRVQPDMLHAMRIPFEGMIAAKALKQMGEGKPQLHRPPLLISVWGNDFTLHARSTRAMDNLTRDTLNLADGLHADCQRDLRLAAQFGFSATKPSIVLPGGGGVQTEIYFPPDADELKRSPVMIINPRGFREYVRNDTFFHALPEVVKKYPEIGMLCPGMEGEGQAVQWVKELKVGNAVELLPKQSRWEMAELFRKSQILVSITTHDGTPNTLLEGMACGCFPIAGDIESLREWITSGENGLLVDPGDPQALTEAISMAIERPEMRMKARDMNLELVRERAEHGMVMQKAEGFYHRVVKGN